MVKGRMFLYIERHPNPNWRVKSGFFSIITEAFELGLTGLGKGLGGLGTKGMGLGLDNLACSSMLGGQNCVIECDFPALIPSAARLQTQHQGRMGSQMLSPPAVSNPGIPTHTINARLISLDIESTSANF